MLAKRMGKPRVIAETGAGQHGVLQLVELILECRIDARVGGQKRRQDLRHEVGHCRGVGKHPQMPAQAAAVFLQVGAQLLGLPQHPACVEQEGFAGWGQAHTACLAVEQAQARLGLERLDTRARRRQ